MTTQYFREVQAKLSHCEDLISSIKSLYEEMQDLQDAEYCEEELHIDETMARLRFQTNKSMCISQIRTLTNYLESTMTNINIASYDIEHQ